jgi:hypothetical protein
VKIYKERMGSFFLDSLDLKWWMRTRSGFGMIEGCEPTPKGNFF